MKYVVTGGAGFIGSHISRHLIANGHDVTIIDNMCHGRKENITGLGDHVCIVNADITDMDAMRAAISGADGIFHQAALTSVPESFVKRDEYYRTNVGGTKNVFVLAQEMGIKTVYASSSSVYGDADSVPISEDSARAPTNPYGITKLDCEVLAERCHKTGSSIVGLRYFNVYGPGQTGSYAGVITKFLDSISNGIPPIIFGDGTKVRDFVHVDDIARANLAAMEAKTDFALLNIGTGIGTSILNLAQTMIQLSKKDLEPEFRGELKGDISTSQADTSRARDLLGWSYEIVLNDGLARFFST